jgi:GT2 family glycosyltransferase
MYSFDYAQGQIIDMKVSIVIPNWNGVEKLRRNLPAVLKVRGVSEVIVSDDASTDDSLRVLKEEFPSVKVVVRKKNGGFSSNVNSGVKEISGDLFLLLNSDASPEADVLEKALMHFENPRVFSVGCGTGGNWNWAKWENGYFWHNQAKGDVAKEFHETLWSSGGSSIFRKSVWDMLGGFDELFDPFYEEDLDIGYRARKRGFINIFVPKAHVIHYKEKGVIALNFSQSTISNTAQRNQLLFIWKNITDPEWTKEHNLALFKMILKHPKYFLIYREAKKRWGQLKSKRELELKEEIVSDREILSKFSDFV